jgi:hypothetical protein
MYCLSVLFQFYIGIAAVIACIMLLGIESSDGLWAVKVVLTWPLILAAIVWIAIVCTYHNAKNLIIDILKGKSSC